jgi:Tol biopolymer transport system component
MRAAVIVGIVGATVIVGTVGATGQDRGNRGAIVFQSIRSGNNDIWLMDREYLKTLAPDRLTRITRDLASDGEPDLSPNGREVVFTSVRAGSNDIFVTDIEGLEAWNLTGDAKIAGTSMSANDGWARWSPDGRQIAFHSNRDGNFEIYVMDADGSNPTRVTVYPGVDQYPDWSPDGHRIVFRRDVDIWVIDLRDLSDDGDAAAHRLTDAPPLNQMPAWSPNGQRIAFMSTRAGYCAVFLMNADGTDQRNLTPKDAAGSDAEFCSRAPAWSPSGRQIYFTSFRRETQGDTEIFVMDADGRNVTRLTASIGVDANARAR